MESLSEALVAFKKIEFPNSPSADSLEDMFVELVQYDGYIAGNVEKVIRGKRLKQDEIYYDLELEEKLRSYISLNREGTNVEEAKVYLLYLKELKGLVEAVESFIKRSN